MTEIGELIKTGVSKTTDLFGSVSSNAAEFISDNLGTIGAGVGGLAIGAIVGSIASSSGNLSKKSTTHKRKNRRRTATHSKKRKGRITKHKRHTYAKTAGKRKDTSHRRIRQTKNGQPYIILASGKARFIKRSSARRSRHKPGGRY
jgi:uncharacterized membrane protein YcjF (UPF0283 family)